MRLFFFINYEAVAQVSSLYKLLLWYRSIQTIVCLVTAVIINYDLTNKFPILRNCYPMKRECKQLKVIQ